jgi:chitodextrinase
MARIQAAFGTRFHSMFAAIFVVSALVSALVATPVAAQTDTTLKAAFAFDENAGTASSDLSGNGHAATLVNGTAWSTGKYGSALSFDGSDDSVSVADGSTINLGTADFTITMWVKRNALGGSGVQRHLFSKCDATVRESGCKELLFNSNTLRFSSFDTGNTNAGTIADNNWHHIAVVFTRSTSRVRIYVDGASKANASRNLEADNPAHVIRIGSVIGTRSFSGLIDEVRVYSRALTATEVATAMSTPVTPPPPDTTPPGAPSAAAATAVSASQINLSWTAATDNVGVTGYAVERCEGSGCTIFAQIATPTATSLSDTGLVAGTTYGYRVRARDAAGNFGAYSNTAYATTSAPDTVAPSAPSGLTATAAGTGQINLAWTASSDNVGVTGYRVERCQGSGCSNFAQVLAPTGTSALDSGLAASTSYSYRVRATDAAGNLSGYSLTASATTATAPAANPIVLENQLQGSSNWQLGDTYNRPYATDAGGQIKGYASAVSVNKGESINFHVTVSPAQTYTIDLYRIGWYGGLGGRLVHQSGPLAGITQPACPMNASTGMVECNWSVSYTLNTQAGWTSGIYLAVLRNAQNYHNYMIFALRDDSRTGALLYQQPVTTAQAYNEYPKGTGKSLYEHLSSGANTMAGTPRAVKVSFDRPYSGWGDGAFLELSEINFLRWAEKMGYDITYSTNLDTHRDGARLRSHRGFLSLPHDEYWSKEMYDAAEAARDAGVNLAFFGANSVFWQIRFEPSSSGVPDRVVVCYKESGLDPVTDPTRKTLQWRDANGPNRPEQKLMGVQFTDGPNSGTATYVVTNSSNWVYAGTGFADGNTVPSLVWYESDRQMSGVPLPNAVPGTYVLLSRSPYAGSNGSDYNNASIYQAPSGAWVFASGTMGWGWGLDNFYPEGGPARADARIQKATQNILNRFLGQ